MAEAIRTTCPYCGVGCGVLARREAEGVAIAGDPDHPANRGRLCVKGAALGETLGLEQRLLQPKLDGRPVTWDIALDRLAGAFRTAIRDHGPESVAFYVSGQLLTEDYYVANKLMKGFLGSGNIDTNSRLCMSSSVAGHSRAFGADTVPGCYEDLELADLVVLVGSNAAWCHPVLYQRIIAAKAARPAMKLVVIDPRRTATADSADLHLALKPGSDVALFNGLLRHLAATGAADQEFLDAHCGGVADALAAATDPFPTEACGLDPALLRRFYDWVAATPKTVTVYSQGVNQSSAGTDKVNAILNCHLLTGRIGRPGMGPLSFTGQPNAMGGREVGGLATTLAAHMGFDAASIDRVGRFWGSGWVAQRAGLKAVDLFQAIEAGQIKAVWIIATNPVVSLPDAAMVRRALERCPFVAVSDCIEATDSAAYADLLLPALAWAEKDGTVTNSERCISRQRPVLPPPGEARPDWWIICQLAQRLGFGHAFDFPDPAAIFQEFARLSAFENHGSRDFTLAGLIDADYQGLQPVQWPVHSPLQGTQRLFGGGGFFHPDRRARLVPTPVRPPCSAASADWPLLMNSGRTRDQWHTMTRTGKSPRLAAHAPEPLLAVHPEDLQRLHLAEGDIAWLESPRGKVMLRLTSDGGQRPGEVFAPMHWNDQFAANAGIGRLIAPFTDPHSGQPELKLTPVRLRPAGIVWEALLVSQKLISGWDPDLYWVRSAGRGFHLYRLAGTTSVPDWSLWAHQRLGDGTWLTYQDRRLGLHRTALLQGGRLAAALYVAPRGQWPDPDGLTALFAAQSLDRPARTALLAGGMVAAEDRGPIICACHQVGRSTLLDAILRENLTDVAAIGRRLKAGTQCGSCLPELRVLLHSRTTPLMQDQGEIRR